MKKTAFAIVLALFATNLHAGSYGDSESYAGSTILAETIETETSSSSAETANNNWLIWLLVIGGAAALAN